MNILPLFSLNHITAAVNSRHMSVSQSHPFKNPSSLSHSEQACQCAECRTNRFFAFDVASDNHQSQLQGEQEFDEQESEEEEPVYYTKIRNGASKRRRKTTDLAPRASTSSRVDVNNDIRHSLDGGRTGSDAGAGQQPMKLRARVEGTWGLRKSTGLKSVRDIILIPWPVLGSLARKLTCLRPFIVV